jgi:hypothetical protein
MSEEDHPDDLEKLQDLSRFRQKPDASSDEPVDRSAQEVTEQLSRARGMVPPGGARGGDTEELPLVESKDGHTKHLPRIEIPGGDIEDSAHHNDGDTREREPLSGFFVDPNPVEDLTEIAKSVQRELAARKKPKRKKRGRRRGDPPQTEPPKTNPQ